MCYSYPDTMCHTVCHTVCHTIPYHKPHHTVPYRTRTVSVPRFHRSRLECSNYAVRSMLKMLLDPMGGIVITNDGNCILREVTSDDSPNVLD